MKKYKITIDDGINPRKEVEFEAKRLIDPDEDDIIGFAEERGIISSDEYYYIVSAEEINNSQ